MSPPQRAVLGHILFTQCPGHCDLNKGVLGKSKIVSIVARELIILLLIIKDLCISSPWSR
jgi:hypothetical protein